MNQNMYKKRSYNLSPIASHSSRIDINNDNLLACSRLLSSDSGQICFHHSVGLSFLSTIAGSSSASDTIPKKKRGIIY